MLPEAFIYMLSFNILYHDYDILYIKRHVVHFLTAYGFIGGVTFMPHSIHPHTVIAVLPWDYF